MAVSWRLLVFCVTLLLYAIIAQMYVPLLAPIVVVAIAFSPLFTVNWAEVADAYEARCAWVVASRMSSSSCSLDLCCDRCGISVTGLPALRDGAA